MQRLLTAIDTRITQINSFIGRSLAWLTLLMALIVGLIVFLRAVFDIGFVAMQESVTYMHASLFMLCLAFTAQTGGHVRVDILYRRFSPTGKAWINLLGALIFLLPFAVFLTAASVEFALNAWVIKEGSDNPGGIPAVFLLKTLIPVTGVLLALRAIGEIAHNLLLVSFKEHAEEHPEA